MLKVVEDSFFLFPSFSSLCDHSMPKHFFVSPAGIARAGKGTAQFVSATDIGAKVMKQLKEAIQPALQDVRVDWGGIQKGKSVVSPPAPAPAPAAPTGQIVGSLMGYLDPPAQKPKAPPEPKAEVFQAPYVVPPVFDSQHFLIYGMFSENKPPSSVKISARSPDGPLEVELPVDGEKITTGKLLHTLAARAMIRDLEEGTSWMSERGFSNKSSQFDLFFASFFQIFESKQILFFEY